MTDEDKNGQNMIEKIGECGVSAEEAAQAIFKLVEAFARLEDLVSDFVSEAAGPLRIRRAARMIPPKEIRDTRLYIPDRRATVCRCRSNC